MADRISELMEEGSLYIALLAAWVAMLGSLYFSEVAGYIPCAFCWYQRILMYPLAAIIAVGLLRRDSGLPLYVLPFSVFGIGVSTYHYLLQKTDLFSELATCQMGVPCSGIWINWLGFITIPFLALTAFLIITFMSIIAWQAGVPAEPDWEDEGPIQRPWLPVLGTIAVVSIAFFVLAQVNGTAADAHAEAEHDTTFADTLSVVETDAEMTIDEAAAISDGQQLYAEACAACHGPDGEGIANLGSNLIDSTLIQTGTDEEILAYIRAGSMADAANNQSGIAMPASGGRPDLSDEQMLSIVHYLQTNAESP